MHMAVHNIKQMDGESTRAFVTRYTDDTLQILGLHEEKRVSGFVHGLKTRSLFEFLYTYLLTTYKGLIEKTYTWIEAKEVATNGASSDHKEGFDSPREILAAEKVAKAFEQPPRMVGSRRSRDMSKYCHFHEDHKHETNQCRELRHQIEEDVKSGQLAHLPSIRALRVDSNIPLIGFSGEHSMPLGKVPLEVTIMGIVVSTIHATIKFHTPRGIGTVFSTTSPTRKGSSSMINTLSKKVVIGKQLPTSFKRKLQDLLQSNEDVYAWTYANMTEIPRTIMVGGMPFNTEHKSNLPKAGRHAQPEEMLFGVKEGLFLGHLITKQGIKGNTLKVKEITDLKPPRTLKDIQSINGKLASLSRFFSKGADKLLSFFKALKSSIVKKTIQ
ncbi:hypothetical protein Tco_0485589 [Tanacetum coccineum]